MFRSKSRILCAKLETEYGTDPTPTVAANAIECKNIRVNYVGDKLERDNLRSHISPSKPVIGKRKIEVSFECEVKGSGTAGTAPAIGALLQACGMSESIGSTGGSSSVVYDPRTTSMSSITIYVYDIPESGNCVLHKITGARGSWKITAAAGQYGRVEFRYVGKYNAPTDVTSPGAATYETTSPPIVNSASFTLNGVSSLVAQEVSIDAANELSERDDINTANALHSVVITGRKPTGSFNPEQVLAATYDFYADWIAATGRALSMLIGATAGNKCTVTAPNLTIDSISDGDRSGVRTNDLPFSLSASAAAGNDEVKLTFA